MDVNQLYLLTNYIVGKNISNGSVSPDEFNNLLMPTAQAGYLDYLLGEYQKYQIKRPIAVVEFGQNQRIRQSLAPLIYGTKLNINSQGISPFPSDYEYQDAMWSVYGNYNIRFIQQDRLDSYQHSTIDPISTNPVYLLNNDGFNFIPERPYDQNQAKLSYVRTPPSIFWGYDINPTTGLPVYNASKSQQPIWADTDIIEVLVRALRIIGVNLQVRDVMQYAEEIKQQGQ